MVNKLSILSKWLESKRINLTKPYIKGDVLDVGCGPATNYRSLKNKIGAYYGIEYDKKHVEKLKKMYPKAKFFSKDLDKDNLDLKKKFDTVVSLAVIEHIYNQKHFIEQLIKNLKPKGRLVLTTPTPFGNDIVHRFGAWIGLFSKVQGDDHIVLYNKKRFQLVAKDFNLRLVKYKSFQLGCNQMVIFQKK